MWTPRDLLRLDLSGQARDLAELAASMAPTYAVEDAAAGELVELLTVRIRDQLEVDSAEDGLSRFTMPYRDPHRRAVAAIDCTEVPLDPTRAGGQRSAPAHGIDDDVAGWWLWPVDEHGEPDPAGGEQPLDVDRSAPREQAEHVALQEIAAWIASDLAKGTGPFDPGGIAGPRQS